MFSQILTVYFENYIKYVSAFCDQPTEFLLNVKEINGNMDV
jgi:hypothetical protein